MSNLEIQAGRKYITSGGQTAHVLNEFDGGFGSQVCMYGYIENGWSNTHTAWSRSGENFCMSGKEDMHLVEEVKDND